LNIHSCEKCGLRDNLLAAIEAEGVLEFLAEKIDA